MKIKQLLILLITALIGVVSLYIFIVLPNNEDSATEETNVNTNVNNFTQTEANSNSPVSMLTYQNNQYGFSFYYPETATVSTSEFLTNAGSIYIVQPGDPKYDANEEYNLKINVGVVEGKTLDEFAELFTQKTGIATTVDDINGRRVESKIDMYDNTLAITTVFIGPNNNYYNFNIEIGPPVFAGEILGNHSQEYLDSVRDTYDSILESFKFIN